jgi:A/G-specific adenine glycosylase
LGPYTIGAILSFAFHQKKAAVDGNVLRVLARYFRIEEDIAKLSTLKKLRSIAESILPEEESWICSEALIELGATVCGRKANCLSCPLRQGCQSHLYGVTDQLPIKTKGAKTEYLYRAVAIIRCDNQFLVKKGKKGEIMSDLYEFPYFEISREGIQPNILQRNIQKQWNLSAKFVQIFPSVEHGFTRYQARLDPCLFDSKELLPINNLEWLDLSTLKQKAFSSGHRRIFQALLDLEVH